MKRVFSVGRYLYKHKISKNAEGVYFMNKILCRRVLSLCVALVFLSNQLVLGAAENYSALRPQHTAGKIAANIQASFVESIPPDSRVSSTTSKSSSAGNMVIGGVDVSMIWEKAVRDNILSVVFTDPQSGNEIESNLQIDADSGEIIPAAKNITTGEEIDVRIIKDTIPGTDFTKEFHPIRALRVDVNATISPIGRQPDMPAHSEKCGFYCTDEGNPLSLLRRQPLLEARAEDRLWQFFHTPFVMEPNGHLICVPDISNADQRREQALTYNDIKDIINIMARSDNAMAFFNAKHAGATVNHIHFQMLHHDSKLAIEKASFAHKANVEGVDISLSKNYPINTILVESLNPAQLADAVYTLVELLQKKGIPFNVVFIGNKVYIFPRNINAERVSEFRDSGLASMELAGKTILTNRDTYDGVTAQRINSALEKISLSEEEVTGFVDEAVRSKSSSAGLSPAQMEQFKAFFDPNLTVDQMNARRLEGLIDKGLLTTSEFFWMEDELGSIDVQDTISSLLKGELNIYIYSAGEASRMMESLVRYGLIPKEDSVKPEVLRKYRRWNTDIWGLVELIQSNKASLESLLNQKEAELAGLSETDKAYKDTKTDVSTLKVLVKIANDYADTPEYARHLTIGPRHIHALVDGITKMAQTHGFDAKEVLSKLKLTIGVNNEILEDAQEDFKANNFFGLTPANAVFVMNDFAPAYKLVNGEFVPAEEGIHTNYNHGFNIINANTEYSSYIYDPTQGRFVLQQDKALDYLLAHGAKTTLIHRSNDLITMVPELALDLDMYAMYRHLHQKYGANVLIEVLNNLLGQKGGLLLARSDQQQQGPFGLLAEGLATKTDKVQAALKELTETYQAKGLPGIPYNRLYQYFDIAKFKANLDASSNLMPMSIKDDAKTPDGKKTKGFYSPEIPTGDQTILEGSKTVAVMRMNDTLIDNRILPADPYYTPGGGTLIHDFKELANLLTAIAVVGHQDREALKTSSAGVTLSAIDSNNIILAAEAANLSNARGTIAYDDTRLSPNQQQALKSLIGIGTQGLAELELKLGCKVKLLSQGSVEDNPNTIIISNEQSANYTKAKYFIIDQTHVDLEDKAVYIAVFSHIPIAKGLLGLTDKTQQPELYTVLKQSIRSLSQGLLNQRDIEDAIDAYLSGKPLFIKLPPAVSYEGRFEDLQKAELMALIAA